MDVTDRGEALPAAIRALIARGPSEDDCWTWTGATTKGYGRVWVAPRRRMAHRHVYELLVGPIPLGLHLDHLCRNRSCVNPAHLEPVTARENNARCPAWGGNQSRCKNGHPYTADSTYVVEDRAGALIRRCRICRRETMRRLRQEARTQ